MWTLVAYRPVALFSLKPASATSSGGKTLICPTPFAIKMALLDAAIRTRGIDQGRSLWPEIRGLELCISLPEHIVVINTFTKIVRPKKNGPSDDQGTGLATPLNRTIAYREYVNYGGALHIAVRSSGKRVSDAFTSLFRQINYLGKRGSFLQFTEQGGPFDDVHDSTITSWIPLTEDQQSFAFDGTLQVLDDCGPKLSFEQVDIYSGKRMTLGKERILRHIVLPYRVTRSSRGFTLYERIA